MKHILIASLLVAPLFSNAQDLPQPSPLGKVEQVIGLTTVSVEYSRPSVKGRAIFGDLVPMDKVWRTGANKCTVFTTDGLLIVQGEKLPPGAYSLFTIPTEDTWTIIFNKTAKQWGAFKYDVAMDYGRAPMKVSKPAAPVEQMTIAIEKKNDHEAVLKVMWDDSAAAIDIMVH